MPLTLPPPSRAALLLDLDGTLLDIAPTPDMVRVAPGLVAALTAVKQALGGALAVVTGRPIDQVDGLLPGLPHAVAGEHGGAIRHSPRGEVVRADLAATPVAWVLEAAGLVERNPGTILEQKQRGFVVHYRLAPDRGAVLHDSLAALIEPDSDRFQLMPALMAWEVRPRGADKGSAVHALMTAEPFAGRAPIFIGDDVTDEDGMAAARELDGAGLRVDEWFGTPDGVRAWLSAGAASLSAGGEWPELPFRA